MKPSQNKLRIAVTAGLIAVGLAASYFVADAAAAGEKVIRIGAKRFDYAPAHLTLKKGVPVVLELRSSDVLVGFNLPDFNVRGDMIPGKPTRVRFVPDKTGTFTFLCDIFCGSGHERMQGTITVVD